MNKLVEIRNLFVGYENNPNVLKDINLTVYDDDFLGIIGPNGGGKTTLVKAILGLIKPTKGTITFFENGEKVNSLNIGYLPQVNQIDKKFPITVADVILSGLTLKGRIFKRYSSEDRQKVRDIAEQMGVENLLSRQIGELSGGQLQRVLLARAIIDEPRLIILDEPGSYVDKRFETNFYRLLADLNEKMVIILVSHDIGTIISNVKNIACVNGDLHYHAGTEISPEWLLKAYDSCPIEILGHGALPHRVLMHHDHKNDSVSDNDIRNGE
jgi:zinc transport system ATP-binding protein